MGAFAPVEIDAWLREGGMVVAASDRAARALAAAFHRVRQAEGLNAWPAPNILDWKSFARKAWNGQSNDSRMLLNPAQEQALWAEIAAADSSPATLLAAPRHRIAALAMEAHELLCSSAPRYLHTAGRAGWQQDAASFSAWLTAFDASCLSGNLLSPSRLPLELIPLLAANSAQRPPLLLVGFDRILPVQRNLFDSWGVWREAAQSEPAAKIQFRAAADAQSELAACAVWCSRHLAANPEARLLVVTQAANTRRGEIERAFLRHAGAAFEFSLGVPLSQVAIARAAQLLLRFLDGTLQEQELDWLLSTGYIAATAEESAALVSYMRTLRRFSLERIEWTLTAFLGERCASTLLPRSWVERIATVQRHLAATARRMLSPLDWAELLPRLLDDLAFATARPLSSTEFQAQRRWQQAVEGCASLGFNGQRMNWRGFLAELDRALDETLFAPESHDAPIQIAGPAESAGLTADAIWSLGTDEDAWPAAGTMHPLLPVEIQRQSGMPHASPQLDWELAAAISHRLLASAQEVYFSYARQNDTAEARPSRLIALLAGPPQPLPPELEPQPAEPPLTVSFEDFTSLPFSPGKVPGGANILTAQSQCPFKAFATARLAAQTWNPAQAGLTAAQRGSLLHAVLHGVWSGPPDGIRTHAELLSLTDRQAFIAVHVHRALTQELPPHLRQSLPRRYLELEEQRLALLVSEWLDYEAARIAFQIAETEAKRPVSIAGLTFDLRLDRIDRLADDSQLVIDYKSGNVTPSAWDLPRPDDVQLPLYAGFALNSDEVLGGLVFAKVRAGDMSFAGRVGDAAGTLFSSLKGTSPLVRNPFTAEQLLDWRDCIEQLARDFLAGKAEVDPRQNPKTCERCGLQTLCRIQENVALPTAEDESDSEEGSDESR
ncbi:MAG: PD-(D/E)XK nuclease family protein [Terracidiphilus sp.]|jgi:probable DNA repair protein